MWYICTHASYHPFSQFCVLKAIIGDFSILVKALHVTHVASIKTNLPPEMSHSLAAIIAFKLQITII